MAHPIILIENAFINRLLGHTQINLIASGFVFPIQAPPGNSMPYIEVRYAGGGNTNTSPRDDVEVVMQVIGYSTDNEQSGQLAGYFRDALHEQYIALAGWSNYYIQEDRLIERVKYGDQMPVYIRGALYEVRADKNTTP